MKIDPLRHDFFINFCYHDSRLTRHFIFENFLSFNSTFFHLVILDSDLEELTLKTVLRKIEMTIFQKSQLNFLRKQEFTVSYKSYYSVK